MIDKLAGSKTSILAHLEKLRNDRKAARLALHAMISGDAFVLMSVPADALSAVSVYKQRIAALDEMIGRYEADLAAGRYFA